MNQASIILALSLLSLGTMACAEHGSQHVDEVVVSAPSFFEAEPNDDSFNANDMGLLYPGDYFFIEGSISDDGFDPFDGFLFTSAVPVHVDFRLFIDNQLADFDVCLYDPLFDEIVDCFETSNNPEAGGVDLLADFVDFHLVVSSFLGSGTYGLEIDVQPLFLREGQTAPSTRTNQLIQPRFSNAAAQAESDLSLRSRAHAESFGDYRREAQTRGSIKSTSIELDPENGVAIETVRIEAKQ